jgi:hypothetical protein
LAGVLCQNEEKYISFTINRLQAKLKAGGLDKKKANVFDTAACKPLLPMTLRRPVSGPRHRQRWATRPPGHTEIVG